LNDNFYDDFLDSRINNLIVARLTARNVFTYQRHRLKSVPVTGKMWLKMNHAYQQTETVTC